MKKFYFALLLIQLFAIKGTVFAANEIKVSTTQKNNDIVVSVTTNFSCNGTLSLNDGKLPPGYSKTAVLFFSQPKTLAFTFNGFTSGKTYYVEATCTESVSVFKAKTSFVFNKTTTTPPKTTPKTQTNNQQTDDQTPKPTQDPVVIVDPNKDQPKNDQTPNTPPQEKVYKFLAPLGDGFSCMSESGKNEAGEEGKCMKGGIGSYLNTIFMLIIGIAGVLAVVMIIVHSIQYMGDESVFGKTEAKAGIKGAIFGLLIALGAYALLNTINPSLTGKDGVSVDGVEIELENIEGDSDAGEVGFKQYVSIGKPGNGVTGYDFKNAKFPSGIICPAKGMGNGDIPTIAKSFVNKITYAQLEKPPKGPRGTPTQTGHFFLDCSSYATTVLKCAGINPPGYAFTTAIFEGGERVDNQENITIKNKEGYINGKKLGIGDLVGWKPSDSKKGGHVLIYIGNGQVIDSHGGKGRNPGQSVTGAFSLEYYKKQIRWVKKIK